MQNLQINDSLSFRGFNYHKVSGVDRNIIRKDFKQLRQLGKEYDIILTSVPSDVHDFTSIDIVVRPLKENLGFFKRIFCPTGKSNFKVDHYSDGAVEDSIVYDVEVAIEDLKNKLRP